MTEEFDAIRTRLLDFELNGITNQQKGVLARAIEGLLSDAVKKRDALAVVKVQNLKTRLDALIPGELGIQQADIRDKIPGDQDLVEEISAQKDLMIAVSTGGSRIQEKNQEYQERRLRIMAYLLSQNIDDPNPYPDLWDWYGKWSSGDLPTYQSRRKHISDLYQSLLDYLVTRKYQTSKPIREATGWMKVDRILDNIGRQIESAKNEEEFQAVGLLCREVLISLAQSVYDPALHLPVDGIMPSPTDADRMLQGFFTAELESSSNEASRRLAKAALSLANELQHKQTATFRDAALCAEATRSVTNIVAILAGKRNP